MGLRKDAKLTPAPTEGWVLSTVRRQRLVALAHQAQDLRRNQAFLRGLSMAGHSIVLMWVTGRPGKSLDFLSERHPPLANPEPSDTSTGSASSSLEHCGPVSLVEAITRRPHSRLELSRADGVIAFGDEARAVVGEVARGLTEPVPHSDLAGWAALSRTWQQLRARAEANRLTPGYARHLIRLTAIVEDPAPVEVQVVLTDLLAELVRSGNHAEAIALLHHLRPSSADPVEAARRRVITAQVRTSATGIEDPDLQASTTALVTLTDSVLADGDLEQAAVLATICLSSLFRAGLHSAGLSSPLVDEPDRFLASWRGSRIGRLLGRPTPEPVGAEGQRDEPAVDPVDRRILICPGSYPQFAEPVTADLRERAHVTVETLNWQGRSDAVGLGVRGELVEARLRQAMGERIQDEALLARFQGVDCVFIDWADRGAILALMHVPEGARVTLRIHSMDALSPWVHLIDWSVVDDLVFVSDHLRDVVARLIDDRLLETRSHVVPNAVDLSRIPVEKSTGHRRHLLMVGWATRVKDAEWALEVLALLRAADPTWHLTLVGPDTIPRTTIRSTVEHATRLRDRLAAADVVDAIEVVPETRDLAPYWRAAGFVLNTSRRESFALALVEGVASGAVPVVRNWPIFAGLDGARRIFPSDWVVDTVEEAAERIQAHAEHDEWARASEAARAFVQERFLNTRPERTLGDIVLGETAADERPDQR